MVDDSFKRAIKWSYVEKQYSLSPLFGMAAEHDFEKAWKSTEIAFNILALGEATFENEMTNHPVTLAARIEQLKHCWYLAVLKGLGVYESDDPDSKKTARVVKYGIDSFEAFRSGRRQKLIELAIAGGIKDDPEFKGALPPNMPRRKYETMFY